YLENPAANSIQSGIGLISGWACAPATVTYSIDNGPLIPIPAGGVRTDTSRLCGGQSNNGFGLLFNYNTLAQGQHTLRAFANGVQIGQSTFAVTNLGGEFLQGLPSGWRYLDNFPSAGTRTAVAWQQEKQNFSIVGTDQNAPSPIGT